MRNPDIGIIRAGTVPEEGERISGKSP